MDGQVGNDGHGFGRPPVATADLALFFLDDDLPGERERPVEPGVPESSSVGLDGSLGEIESPGHLAVGGQLEHRTVSVSPDDLEPSLLLVELRAHCEGNQGGVVSGQEVLLALF